MNESEEEGEEEFTLPEELQEVAAVLRKLAAYEKAEEAKAIARIQAAAMEAFARRRRRVPMQVLVIMWIVGYMTGATIFGPWGRGALASLIFAFVVVLLARWGLREDDPE